LEQLWTQCSVIMPANTPLLLAVFVAGLVGSASHCSVMCSPAVMSQMLDLQSQKQSQLPMLFYHLGRIATYALLGVLSYLLADMVFGTALPRMSNALLLVAGATFLASAMLPRKTHRCCSDNIKGLYAVLERLRSVYAIYTVRGVLMGFMPCGLLISVLLLASTSDHVLTAAVIMILFGAATVPVLQLAGYGSLSLGRKFPHFSAKLGRASMAMNGLFLCAIGLNLVKLH